MAFRNKKKKRLPRYYNDNNNHKRINVVFDLCGKK